MSKSVIIKGKPFLLDPKKDKKICGYPEAGFIIGMGTNSIEGAIYTLYLHKIGEDEIFYIYDEKDDPFYSDEYKNYDIISKEKLQAVILEYANSFSKDEIANLKSIGIALTEEEAHKNLLNPQKQAEIKNFKKEDTKSGNRRLKAIELLSLAQKNLLSKDNIKNLRQSLYYVWTAVMYLNRSSEFYWVNLEINGYIGESNLPEYRKVDFEIYDDYGFFIEVIKDYYKPAVASIFYQLKNGLQSYPDPSKKTGYRIVIEYSLNNLLQGLYNRLLETVNTLLLELEYGEILRDIFESLQDKVNTKLLQISKPALEELNHSFSKIKEDKPQDWSDVALSCRRMMKYVADAIFPPRAEDRYGKDGKIHSLKDDKVVNRLMAFIDSGISENDDNKKETIKYFDSVINKIWKAFSKGVHTKITREDAERLLIDSYLFLSDLFNLN